ncbi:Response regulator of citrate/malate metabolism [Lacticaseibacillus paracasei]|nr:Response regulator of citrate/malate metabolism [Lacticaseibacillus paracasei]
MTNILIVEDDPMVQFIHRNYLEKIAPILKSSATMITNP